MLDHNVQEREYDLARDDVVRESSRVGELKLDHEEDRDEEAIHKEVPSLPTKGLHDIAFMLLQYDLIALLRFISLVIERLLKESLALEILQLINYLLLCFLSWHEDKAIGTVPPEDCYRQLS